MCTLLYLQSYNFSVLWSKISLNLNILPKDFLGFSAFRNSHPEVFLGKGVLKVRSKPTGEHPWWSAISIKLQSNFIGTTLWYGCSPVNFLYIFRTPFPKITSGRLLLSIFTYIFVNNSYLFCFYFIFIMHF